MLIRCTNTAYTMPCACCSVRMMCYDTDTDNQSAAYKLYFVNIHRPSCHALIVYAHYALNHNGLCVAYRALSIPNTRSCLSEAARCHAPSPLAMARLIPLGPRRGECAAGHGRDLRGTCASAMHRAWPQPAGANSKPTGL